MNEEYINGFTQYNSMKQLVELNKQIIEPDRRGTRQKILDKFKENYRHIMTYLSTFTCRRYD